MCQSKLTIIPIKMVQLQDMARLTKEPPEYSSDRSTLLAKYQIPITHFDFDYVEKCTDGKELEQILHVLRSGEEGHYPDLMQTVEERVKIYKPRSKLLRHMSKVLNKEELEKSELKLLTEDMNDWVVNISKDNKELELRKGTTFKLDTPTVREHKEVVEEPRTKTENPKRIAATDYASWDKYDPDTEILKMDLDEEKIKQTGKKEAPPKEKPKKRVTFNSFATEAEASFEANREREKGNECFKAKEYQLALNHYTSSLECKTTVLTLNNRAITHIKMSQYEAAVNDCDSVLVLDQQNIKAHLRRAIALEKLDMYDEALESAESCIQLDPNNTTAQEVANRVRKRCVVNLRNKRFSIEDVNMKDVESKECVRIVDKEEIKKTVEVVKTPVPRKATVIIPIPGTSRMPQPYYVICPNDPESIYNTMCHIYNRTQLIGFVNSIPEEEECIINHLHHICTRNRISSDTVEKENIVGLDSNISSKGEEGQILKKCTAETAETSTPDITSIKEDENQLLRVKKTSKHVLPEKQILHTDKEAGGEPHPQENDNNLPQDIHLPYTFLKTWTSVGNDPSLKKYADIIRTVNMSHLVRVIGCKLDNDMFSIVIRCLCMHFTVPGEVEKVLSVLVNIVRLPRFKIISMLMSEQDRNYVHMLISFLHQHDKTLPEDVINDLM